MTTVLKKEKFSFIENFAQMGVPGLGHWRSFGGSRPQTSPPRFLELEAPRRL